MAQFGDLRHVRRGATRRPANSCLPSQPPLSPSLPPPSSLPACHGIPRGHDLSLSLLFSLSTSISIHLYLFPLFLSMSSLVPLDLRVSRLLRLPASRLLYFPVCLASLPPLSPYPSLVSRASLYPAPPLVSYTALSVVCGSHASISIALRASCLAYRVSVSRLSCFLCLPVSRLSYLPSHALSWAHPRLHPACLVMPDDLSLHPNLPPALFCLVPSPPRALALCDP